ncbi:MAG TPA: hypothetical protein VLF14_07515 [Candidatus Binatia bacterium]|nr:hypothetical protein [Candidatus Binatia bacterium]
MPSLREALSSRPPALDSAAEHAARMGTEPPVSLRELILASDVKVFEGVVTTPPGSALGGWIRLVVAGDGRYTFSGHMHGSGFDPYQFSIHVLLRGDFIGLSLRKSGSVGGTIGGGSRDFDWSDADTSEPLRTYWPALREGSFEIVKSYDDTGLLGTAIEVGETFLAFLVANALVGPQIAAIVICGPELLQLVGVHPSPQVFAGVVVSGATVMLCGPGLLIPGMIAGYGASTFIRSRHLNAAEEAVARSVFDDSLDFSRIYLTDIKGPDSDRAFCTLQPDGTILVNLGDEFGAPLASSDRRKTLIHELVHAWQCIHAGYDPEMIWQAATNHLVGSSVYEFQYGGQQWSSMNFEAQAAAVATWYSMFESYPSGGLQSTVALNSPLFGFVANHIRPGVD